MTEGQTRKLEKSEDIVALRQAVGKWMQEQSFRPIEQVQMATAASELARNTVDHGGGGQVAVEYLETQGRRGIRLTFQDHGPGIQDVEQALQDGYSTAGGLGLGLGGSRRLVNEFQIYSRPGQGTRVIITRWKR